MPEAFQSVQGRAYAYAGRWHLPRGAVTYQPLEFCEWYYYYGGRLLCLQRTGT
jgi:hypothetical protein